MENFEKFASSLKIEKQQLEKSPEMVFLHKHLDKLPLEQPSADFTATLMQKIYVSQTAQPYKPLLSRRFFVVFGICLISFLAFLLFLPPASGTSVYVRGLYEFFGKYDITPNLSSLVSINLFSWFSESWAFVLVVIVANLCFASWLDQRLSLSKKKQ